MISAIFIRTDLLKNFNDYSINSLSKLPISIVSNHQRHCIGSLPVLILSKAHLSLFGTGSIQEDQSQYRGKKLLTWTYRIKSNKQSIVLIKYICNTGHSIMLISVRNNFNDAISA